MQLNLKTFLERTESYLPQNAIVSRQADGKLFRYHYADYCRRTRQLASALAGLGVKPGDKVATLGWNTYRHMELYFAVPCLGAILHTVNIRLTDEHIAYIMNHAEDVVLFVDPDLLPTMERVAPSVRSLRHIIVMDDRPAPLGDCDYESFLATGDPDFAFPELDENSPCGMCFTSATTGDPKGVVYTQRGLYLHTLALCLRDVLAISEHDTVLPVVPMFHANSWGLPYAAVAVGATIVLPGPHPTAADILDLIEAERGTFCAAAVTIGVELYAQLKKKPRDISSLRGLMLGGSATPEALMKRFHNEYGVPILTAWGATEAAPLATITHVRRSVFEAGPEERIKVRVRQGIPVPGVELKVLDDCGKPVPRDDGHPGEVHVRGPWIATEYYRDTRSRAGFVDGWWRSGDIATQGSDGSIHLIDRAKDLVKSGGEWISSVDLENELAACPGVREAAVVAMPDARWQERPVAFVVPVQDSDELDPAHLSAWLARRFVKWWIPDRFVFVPALPKSGVGKVDKRSLRERAATLAP
ncbi:long-chain fatty acid--CoA ligase [Bradyrhizobium sp. INPA01-394B]|uniref:Long-chain fatty acid--CoA ligase n=1 Tax=Bradyrhizobium campsiandrae TaxID=1729892 RepID=A0ABR7UH37_9BRAD|nr:long-chain fatty acid--CoA ligase [Bradyrhizobium campsiandrae]MBC9882305.1 long-chain fatty acid--CoA ligase [Bradyrhizobium campsiandrae]MBC9983197.1 long-chain fatty acid--CoA ligase [Bradyrhizobium campsiandrae]